MTDAAAKTTECPHGIQGLECPVCSQERAKEARERQMARERIASWLGGLRAFEMYRLERFRPSKITEKALAAAKEFNPAKDNLYLHGPVGTGKSHLAIGAARQHLEIKGGIVAIKPQQIARKLRALDSAAEEDRFITTIAGRGVLVIEDLGAEKDTEFMASLLYEVIDWRYMNRPGGLIITSNLSLDDLTAKLHDERISSRLSQICRVFSMAGEPDHRISKV